MPLIQWSHNTSLAVMRRAGSFSSILRTSACDAMIMCVRTSTYDVWPYNGVGVDVLPLSSREGEIRLVNCSWP